MTEYEKLLAGLPYDYMDPALRDMVSRAQTLRKELELASDPKSKEDICRKLFTEVGKNPVIHLPFYCLYGTNMKLGDDCFINSNCFFQDSNWITMKDRVIIAPNCCFYCGEHAKNAADRFETLPDGTRRLITVTRPISIGSDVWIGGNVTVVAGAEIGDNVIIGAGAVVTGKIPSNCIAAGVPARVIKPLAPLADKTAERSV